MKVSDELTKLGRAIRMAQTLLTKQQSAAIIEHEKILSQIKAVSNCSDKTLRAVETELEWDLYELRDKIAEGCVVLVDEFPWVKKDQTTKALVSKNEI